MPPVVLVTTDRRDGGGLRPGPRVRPIRSEACIGEVYVDAVRAAGGVPLLAPPGDAPIDLLLQRVDAVVLTGGDFDIHPSWYGERPKGRIDRVEPSRTTLELGLARACLGGHIPILGVCGGMQALAVASGGALHQDLAGFGPEGARIEHEQPTDPAEPWHPVEVASWAQRWLGQVHAVNSTHHQGVRTPGASLEACAWSPDGLIEAIARRDSGFALGVQWHPEVLGDLEPYRALMRASVR